MGVFVRVFPEEMSICMGELRKVIALTVEGELHLNHWEPKQSKNWRKGDFAPFIFLPHRAGISHLIFSCPLTGIYTSHPLWFSGL